MFWPSDFVLTIYFVQIRTDVHQLLVIKRDNGLAEWIFFRDTTELDRILCAFREQWNIPTSEGNNDSEFLRMSICSSRVPDLWNLRQNGINKINTT